MRFIDLVLFKEPSWNPHLTCSSLWRPSCSHQPGSCVVTLGDFRGWCTFEQHFLSFGNFLTVSTLCLQALSPHLCFQFPKLLLSPFPLQRPPPTTFSVHFKLRSHSWTAAITPGPLSSALFCCPRFCKLLSGCFFSFTALHCIHGTLGIEILQRVWPVRSHTCNNGHPCRKHYVSLEIELALGTYSLGNLLLFTMHWPGSMF